MSSPYTNGKAYDFTSTYKYSTASPSTTTTTPPFTRMTYAKDSRGHMYTEATYPYATSTDTESQSLTSSSSTASDAKIEYGSDGLPRGPYDLGQRVRPMSFFSRKSSSNDSVRSSRASLRSSFFAVNRRDGSTSTSRS